jgi:hypothetical protein
MKKSTPDMNLLTKFVFFLLTDSSEYLNESGFGLTVSADEYDLFTCAPFANLEEYGLAELFVTGVCYK